jgi:hypothetical protein
LTPTEIEEGNRCALRSDTDERPPHLVRVETLDQLVGVQCPVCPARI